MDLVHRIWSPLTLRARTLLIGGLVLLVAGLTLRITDLTRVGVFVTALPLVAVAVVARARLRIACARHSDPPVAIAGSAVEVVLTLTNRSLVPTGALLLEDQMPSHLSGQARFTLAGLGPQESRAVVYRLADVRRGRYVTGPLRIRIDDAFGLVDITRSFTGRSEFLVSPRVEVLSSPGPAVAWDTGENAGSRSVGSMGAEDASIREYRHGDDLRKIHWRSTARTGTPMVRQDERPWQGRATIVVDTRRSAHASVPPSVSADHDDVRDRDSLEWAVSATASIAERMLASQRDVGLLHEPGRAGEIPRRVPLVTSRDVAVQLAELPIGTRSDLHSLLAPIQATVRDSVVVAVLGELDRTSLDGLTALASATGRSAGSLLAVLLDVEGWRTAGGTRTEPAGAGLRSSTAPNRADLAAARLRAAGWIVAVARHGDDVAPVWDRVVTADTSRRLDVDAIHTAAGS